MLPVMQVEENSWLKRLQPGLASVSNCIPELYWDVMSYIIY